MAAYAAGTSLIDTLKQVYFDNQFSETPNFPKSQIAVLHNRLKILENFFHYNREIKSDFETQIRDVIYEAQDIIDTNLLSSEAEISQSFCQNLERLTQEVNSFAEMVESEEFNHQTLNRKISNSVWKFEIRRLGPCTLFGRYEDYMQVQDRLMSGSERLEIVPIVGIAGMGKTALAHCLFSDRLIREHFDATGWATISFKYNKRETLLDLLGSKKKRGDGFLQKTDAQLAKQLYKSLKNKRCLVVLDDIRDIAVWNDLKESFPDHSNGTRILITTRNVDVEAAPPHQLDRVTDEDSLSLLHNIVFQVDEPCRPELAVIAVDIAQSCKGLPLAVVIVGRLLSCAKLIEEYWEIVLSLIKSMPSLTRDYYVDLMETLVSLTYNHSPQVLKSCLLYMATFPYDYDISIVDLMEQLIAERFFRNRAKMTRKEELCMAYYCLDQLDVRGLISLTEGRTCKIDKEIFHDFIVRKATEEKFFFIINKDTNYGYLHEKGTYNQQRRLCIHKSIPFVIKDLSKYNYSNTSLSTVHTLVYSGPENQYPQRAWLDFKLLKILNALKIRFYTFPREILKLLQLKYLALSCNGQLPAALCKLRNLEALVVLHYLKVKCGGVPSYLPVEIWDMKELNHLNVMGSDLPEPPFDAAFLLPRLLKLSHVSSHTCTPRILKRLRNL